MRLARWLGAGSLALVFTLGSLAHAAQTFTKIGGTLKVTGDAQNDEIAILGSTASGSMQLFAAGLPVAIFDGVRDIVVNSGAGDDFVMVTGVQIGGSIKIKTGAGVDGVLIRGESGQTQRELLVAKNIDVSMGRQIGDEFGLRSQTSCGATIGGNVVVRGASFSYVQGLGGSTAIESSDVRICGDLRIESKVAGDSAVQLERTNVHGATTIVTGNHRDTVLVMVCHFVRPVSIRTVGDDDVILFGDPGTESRFGSSVLVDGGAGADKSNALSFGTFATPPTIKNVESSL